MDRAAGEAQVSEQRVRQTRHKWLVVTLLALGMAIAYVDRANLSSVLAVPSFRDWIGLDDRGRGLLNSAFFWSYALMQIPMGWVVDRYGAKRPYAVGFSVWTLASASAGMAQNAGQLASARLALGVGESVSIPASLRWIRLNCAEKERGLATGILFAGTKIGAAIGAPVTVALVTRFNWRWMFVLCGLFGASWLVAWIISVRDDSEAAKGVNEPISKRGDVRIGDLLSEPTLWGILCGTFAYNYFIYFCLTWLPAYFTEARHLSPAAMSSYTMFSFGGMGIIGILAGWAADRIISKRGRPVRVRRLFTLAGFVAASTEAIGMMSASDKAALFFAIFSLAGLGLATANYWALTQTIFPPGTIGRMVGLQNFASNLSGVVAPIITGWLKYKTGGYEAAGWAILAVLIVGLLSYGLLVRERMVEAPQT
jgi:ACS family D-galactonate transporter-like MFS transporter